MANSINSIREQALKAIQDIKDGLVDANEEFSKFNKQAANTAKGGAGFNELDKRVKSLESSISKLLQTTKKATDQEERQAAITKSRIPNLKQLVKIKNEEVARNNKAIKTYSQLQAKVNVLKEEYKNLAIQKELNNKLSKQETEKLNKLQGELNQYQTTLKKVDAGMGVYTRSVGSYGKAFDSLGFSVAQITRESPAFLNSLNTGFMAISNNIPILVDEINKLRVANVQLATDGKPTVNIVKRLGQALFSWQSLISAAIVALTVLGPKLLDWAFGMTEAEKATEEATKAIEEQNEELRKNIELRSQQVGSLRTLFEDASRFFELTNSESGLQELQTLFEKIGKEGSDVLTDQNILLEDRQQIAKNLLEIEELRVKADKERLKVVKDQSTFAKVQSGEITFPDEQTRRLFIQDLQLSFQNVLDINKDINDLQEENNRIIGKTVILKEKEGKADEIRLKNLQKVSELQSQDSDNDQARRIASTIEMTKAIKNQIKEIESILKVLPKWAEGYDDLRRKADNLKAALDGIDVSGAINEAKQALEDLNNGSGGEDGDGLGWKKYFNSLVPIAQSSLQLIAQAQKTVTQQLLADLEKQKDIAIQFAGESADARAAIEEQYEEKRRKIQKKQAENERANTLFSIVLNTAQAVVAALPNVALSIAVGALGAAQLAVAASTPIPEFFRGTMNAPEGLALVDEKRPEVHTDRHGNIKSFGESKANYRYLERGDKIYKSREEYFSKEIESNIPFNSAMMAYQMAIHNNNQDTLSKADFNRGIDKLMSKETSVVNINKAGFTASVISGNAKKNKMNNILRLKKGIV